jgi:hypothetical protein
MFGFPLVYWMKVLKWNVLETFALTMLCIGTKSVQTGSIQDLSNRWHIC